MPNVTEETPRRRWRWRLAAVLLVLGVGGLAWAAFGGGHLARAQALQDELSGERGKALPPDERKAKFAELRGAMKNLSGDQRAVLFAPMREKMNADLDRYFAMPPREKVKHLDAIIDRSEKSRKDREARAKAGPGPQPGGGPPPGPPRGPGGGGAPAGGFAGGPGGGKGGPRTPDEIEARKKKSLDNSTPEERAKRDQYRKDLDARRKARGLPTTSGRRV